MAEDKKEKDPICGMDVDKAEAESEGLTSEYREETYYFCGNGCKEKFDKNPEQYAK